MADKKRIAMFVDIDNMPLYKKHVDQIMSQLEADGEIVYGKIYGVTDRRHREIVCDCVSRGFGIVPPVYPNRRGSTKVFDVRILVDLCELIATNDKIDGVAIVANPANQVYLFSKLKLKGIKIFGCDNLDDDSIKFVDEILSFGYNDPNTKAKNKKAKAAVEAQIVQDDLAVTQEPIAVEEEVLPQAEVVLADEPQIESVVEKLVQEQEIVAVDEVASEQPTEAEEVAEQPIEAEVEEEKQQEVVEETAEQEIPEVDAVVEEVPQEEEELDILRQIQQMKDDAPSSDDEEDEALIEKIKQLLDEFN